jgi:ATP dependent DNA ligase domain
VATSFQLLVGVQAHSGSADDSSGCETEPTCSKRPVYSLRGLKSSGRLAATGSSTGDSGCAFATLNWPYHQRRDLLEELNLHGSHWDTAMSFEDGEGLFRSVHEIGLEGVVAKKLGQRYRPGERSWIKVKNRDYWRYPLELEAARKRRSTPSMFATL